MTMDGRGREIVIELEGRERVMREIEGGGRERDKWEKVIEMEC